MKSLKIDFNKSFQQMRELVEVRIGAALTIVRATENYRRENTACFVLMS